MLGGAIRQTGAAGVRWRGLMAELPAPETEPLAVPRLAASQGARLRSDWPQLSPGPDKPEEKKARCEGKEAPADKGGKGAR